MQSPGPADNPVRDLSIVLRPYRSDAEPALGLSDYVGLTLRVIALPLVCTALGFWVAAVRIGDRSAWLLLSLLLSLAVTFGSVGPEALFGRGGDFGAAMLSPDSQELRLTFRFQAINLDRPLRGRGIAGHPDLRATCRSVVAERVDCRRCRRIER